MKKIKLSLFCTLFLLGGTFLTNAQNTPYTHYKLDNGLTVFLWEDENQPDVSGSVAFNVGAMDEPAEYSGLAHYLEHVLFKGTETIGALDWAKEKPLYEQIIALYDKLAQSTDEKIRADIEQQINKISIEAAQYATTKEFSNLIEGMGGEGLNAFTSYDMTVYLNRFPSYQMEKWLDLYSERFINPVFRSFQAELENVFEEYNMYEDNPGTHQRNFIFSHIYKGHPYERTVLGSPENLKNPRLGKLIEFYNTWYVPENMALILVGNFKTEDVKPIIEQKFGRLKARKSPTRKQYENTTITKNKKYKAKISPYPQVIWAYNGVKKGDKDEFLLQFCTQLLSNSSGTGLLDKLTLDGDVLGAGANLDSRRDQGRILISGIPYYDVSQNVFESDEATEKIIMKEVQKLANGEIDDWLIELVKNEQKREYSLVLERPSLKANILQEIFVYNLPKDYYDTYIQKVDAVTKADLQRVAKKYFGGKHITLSLQDGKVKKNKLKKPNIKPIEQPKNKYSEYAKKLKNIPVTPLPEVYNDFAQVKKITLGDKLITLHYTHNPDNDIFTLDLVYGVGTQKMPKLAYATNLMRSAGIMPTLSAQDVAKQFGELNGKCTYSVTDDYFTIKLLGTEKHLAKICQLMTKQVLLPKLVNKQLNQTIGLEYQSRVLEQKNPSQLGQAFLSYILYGKKSPYKDRLPIEDVITLNVSELTAEVIKATNYELDVYYTGNLNLDQVVSILTANLPLKEGMQPSTSPNIEEREVYQDQKVYFLPNKDAQQSKIFFYIDGFNYNIEDEPYLQAFNQYLSGGFEGLLMQEIRENNSMAYTVSGGFLRPKKVGEKNYFIGYVGTQGDKAADAIDLYMKILKEMPQHPERITNIKTYLKQANLTNKPSVRERAKTFDKWQKYGYTQDPAIINNQQIDKLTFDDIKNFYEKNIKEKPITIVITGDAKQINIKQIEKKYGKVKRISTSTLFTK